MSCNVVHYSSLSPGDGSPVQIRLACESVSESPVSAQLPTQLLRLISARRPRSLMKLWWQLHPLIPH